MEPTSMQSNTVPQIAYRVAVGDRIVIRRPRSAYASLADRVGTVVEVFRVPFDNCLVHLDDDTHHVHEWFCYRDEVTILGEHIAD
jgi:hypothetical protein